MRFGVELVRFAPKLTASPVDAHSELLNLLRKFPKDISQQLIKQPVGVVSVASTAEVVNNLQIFQIKIKVISAAV